MSSDLASTIESLRSSLETSLNTRAGRFTLPESFAIHTPDLPPSLTPEHLTAIQEALPGLTPRLLPSSEDLNHLDPASNYITMMYPENQHSEDTADGITAKRPSWWGEDANILGITFRTITNPDGTTRPETNGEAFLRSMSAEIATIAPRGALVLLDTAIKPIYIDGSQSYGTSKGDDPTTDPLLPLFQEAFGPDANRFNHTWDEITDTLLPLATQKVMDTLTAKGLTIPPDISLTIQLVPASLDNLEMTIHTPASSQTNCWEWTSTPLLDADGNDGGLRLRVGRSGGGGASDVGPGDRGFRVGGRGARLAVVLKRRD